MNRSSAKSGTNQSIMMSKLKSVGSRDKTVGANIVFSGILKAIGLVASLLVVPVTLHYLDAERYGIWLTLSSILFWFTFSDVGLGNGMRNYLTESISKGDFERGRSYLSTTLFLLSGIAILLGLLSWGVVSFVDMSRLFNTSVMSGEELRIVTLTAIFFTLMNFVVRNIGYLFVALQRYALYDLLSISGSVLSLIVVYVLTKTTDSNLLYVVAAFTAMPVVVYLLACFPIFRRYRSLRPNRKSIDLTLANQVVGKGLGFFAIQITSCLVIFGSSNVFITQFCGPEGVTTYNIAYKYFNLLIIGYTVILSPLWNAYTDAKTKGDYQWVASAFRRSMMAWGATVIGGVLMLLLCNVFYRLWVGDAVSVPFTVSLVTFIYVSMFNLNNCVTYLLNGFNTIRIQIITSVVFTAAYLLAVYCFGKEYGIEGIVASMAVCYAAMSIIHFYQCELLIKQKARGIWNK